MKCDRFIGTGTSSSLDLLASESKSKHASKSTFLGDSHSTVEVSTANHAYNSNHISHGINTSIRSSKSVRGLERRQFSQYSAKTSILDEDHYMHFYDIEESKKATYVTFENNSMFRIPVFTQVHQHKNTLPVIGEMGNLRSSPSVSKGPVENLKNGNRRIKRRKRSSLSVSSKYSKVRDLLFNSM